MCVLSHSVMSDSLQPHGLKPTRLLCPWNSPGKNPGVGCHALLQEVFPTQESNPCLLGVVRWQAGSLPLITGEAHHLLCPGSSVLSILTLLLKIEGNF